MNEIDLKSLSRLRVPDPDETARGNAVERAMLAFDEAGEEQNSPATQGSASVPRPISTKPTLWSNIMSIFSKPLSPSTMALMTGVCLLPIAGVVTWNVFDRNVQGLAPVSQVEQEADQVAKTVSPVSKQAVAADRQEEVGQEAAEVAGRIALSPTDVSDESGADVVKRDDARRVDQVAAKPEPPVEKEARAEKSKQMVEIGTSTEQEQAATSPAQREVRQQPESWLLRRTRERATGLKRAKANSQVAGLLPTTKPAAPNMGFADSLVQTGNRCPCPAASRG